MPSQLVVCRDALVKDIISSELLQQQLSLDYLHHDVTARLSASLVTALGVQTLSTQHLLDLGVTTIAQISAQSGLDAGWPDRRLDKYAELCSFA